MDTFQHKIFAGTATWFSSLSRISRLALVVLATLIVVLFINSNKTDVSPAQCSLLGSCQLSPTEVQQLDLALGRAGISQFQIENGVILVPANRQSEFLKTLADENAIPERLAGKANDSLASGFWPTHGQQKLAAREQKNRQVEQLVSRFSFVEETWLTVNVSKARNAFEPEKRSVVVSIMPANNLCLDRMNIETIRQVIAAAFSGTDSRDIVITDLNAGRAYSGGALETGDYRFQKANWQMISAERQSHYEKEIGRALEMYDGLTFDVVYELKQKSMPGLPGPPDRVAMLPSTQRDPAGKSMRHSETFGANRQVWIEDALGGEPAQGPSKELPTRFALSGDGSGALEEFVAVTISFPGSLLHRAPINADLANPEGPKWNARASIEERMASFKSEIVEKIRPLLPSASFAEDANFPIRFQVEGILPTVETGSLWVQAKQQLQIYWPTATAVLFGTMVLILVGRSSKNPRSEDDFLNLGHSVASGDSAEPNHKSEAERKRDAEERLSRLIESDPEAAAQVIKGWIRDAA